MEQKRTGHGKGLTVAITILAILLAAALISGFLLWKDQRDQQADAHAKAVAMCQTAAQGVKDPEPCADNLTDSQLGDNTTANYARAAAAEKSAADTAKKAAQQAEDQLKKAQAQAAGMNLTQLAQGDFSSIQGTWAAKEGGIIVITGNKVTDSSGKTILHVIYGPDSETCGPGIITDPKLENSSFVSASLEDGRGKGCVIGIIFAAKGIPVDTSQPGSPAPTEKDQSDTTRDRLAMMTNGWNAIFSTPEAMNAIYYRVE